MLLLDLASGGADRRAGEANAAPIDFISSVSRSFIAVTITLGQYELT